MTRDNHISIIYQRFLENSATKQELHYFFSYLERSSEQELKQLLAQTLGESGDIVQSDKNLELLQNVRTKLMYEAERDTNKVVNLRSRKRAVWYYAAASIALVVSVAGFLLLNKKQSAKHSNDLLPGGNLAMLTVGGTDTLNLQQSNTTGLLKKTAGVVIAKTNNGTLTYTAYGTDTPALNQVNTLITPRGGQYHVRLSDGTEVLLNSESKLEFPVGFTGKNRHVVLTGEAYFEVAKNKNKPFIVTTAGQDVEVLGTKFNISNYTEDGGPVTTLTEGSVKVSNPLSTAILTPGQQSHVTTAGIKVTDVDTQLYNAWKNGEFVFENTPLDVIMHKLSRWYDFEIDYSKLPPKSLYMKIGKQVNLSEVLGTITTTTGIKFKIDERRVTVM